MEGVVPVVAFSAVAMPRRFQSHASNLLEKTGKNQIKTTEILPFALFCGGVLMMMVYMRFRSFPVSDPSGASRTVVRGPGSKRGWSFRM